MFNSIDTLSRLTNAIFVIKCLFLDLKFDKKETMGSNEELVMSEVKVVNEETNTISDLVTSEINDSLNLSDTDSVKAKTRHVKLIYCGDGVIEECEEDEEERRRLEEEEQQRQIESEKQMDLEAVKFSSTPKN